MTPRIESTDTNRIRDRYESSHDQESTPVTSGVDINDPTIGNMLKTGQTGGYATSDPNADQEIKDQITNTLMSKAKSALEGIFTGAFKRLENQRNVTANQVDDAKNKGENAKHDLQNQVLQLNADASLDTCDSTLDQASQMITELDSKMTEIGEYFESGEFKEGIEKKNQIDKNNAEITNNNTELEKLGAEEFGQTTDTASMGANAPSAGGSSISLSGGLSGLGSISLGFNHVKQGIDTFKQFDSSINNNGVFDPATLMPIGESIGSFGKSYKGLLGGNNSFGNGNRKTLITSSQTKTSEPTEAVAQVENKAEKADTSAVGNQQQEAGQNNENKQEIRKLTRENRQLSKENSNLQPQLQEVVTNVQTHNASMNAIKEQAIQIGEVVSQAIQIAEKSQQEVAEQAPTIENAEQKTQDASQEGVVESTETTGNYGEQAITGTEQIETGAELSTNPVTAPAGAKVATEGQLNVTDAGKNAPVSVSTTGSQTNNAANAAKDKADTNAIESDSQVTASQVIEKGNSVNGQIDGVGGKLNQYQPIANEFLSVKFQK